MKGISFLGALFLIFLTLRLTNTIDWSWWWIALPLYGPFAVALAILTTVVLFGCAGAVLVGITQGIANALEKK